MEWNAKWDWENFISFGSKSTYSPKKLQFGDMDGEIDSASSPFNLSASLTRSSLSVSAESSSNAMGKMVMKEAEVCGTSLLAEASAGDVEPLIGLKLGKRTYFENTAAVGNVKASSPSARLSMSSHAKSTPIPRCIVEGCSIDLSTAKEYHRKHKVCGYHSKCSKVIVGGVERRFCQQCSRFHGLSEFDDKKRSCRRRLLDHNARRRKPHQETIMLNAAGIHSQLHGGREKMGFLLSNGSYLQTRNSASSSWSTMSRGQNSTHEVLNSGGKEDTMNSQENGGALSLLSTNTWISWGTESVPVHHPENEHVMYGFGELLLPRLHHQSSTQEIQVFKTPYEPAFYPNTLN